MRMKRRVQTRGSRVAYFYLSLIVLLIAFLWSFCLGRYSISFSEVVASIGKGIRYSIEGLLRKEGVPDASWMATQDTIIWHVRMPRIIAAVLAGAALSISGATYQSLFQNPMVSPDILGVAAGASAGACFMMLFNQSRMVIQISAFATGILAVALSYSLSKVVSRGSNVVLIVVLCGMTISTLFQALLTVIKYIADTDSQLPEMTYWLMGSLAKVTDRDVKFFLSMTVVFAVPIILLRWRLNVLSFGEGEAKALGLNVGFIRMICIACATMLTASVVAMAGTIGWVGLMIPHLVRFLFGSDNRIVIPMSLSFGALFLLVVDNICRTLLAYEIPIGVVTSLFGSVVFIAALYRQKRGSI